MKEHGHCTKFKAHDTRIPHRFNPYTFDDTKHFLLQKNDMQYKPDGQCHSSPV